MRYVVLILAAAAALLAWLTVGLDRAIAAAEGRG